MVAVYLLVTVQPFSSAALAALYICFGQSDRSVELFTLAESILRFDLLLGGGLCEADLEPRRVRSNTDAHMSWGEQGAHDE